MGGGVHVNWGQDGLARESGVGKRGLGFRAKDIKIWDGWIGHMGSGWGAECERVNAGYLVV